MKKVMLLTREHQNHSDRLIGSIATCIDIFAASNIIGNIISQGGSMVKTDLGATIDFDLNTFIYDANGIMPNNELVEDIEIQKKIYDYIFIEVSQDQLEELALNVKDIKVLYIVLESKEKYKIYQIQDDFHKTEIIIDSEDQQPPVDLDYVVTKID